MCEQGVAIDKYSMQHGRVWLMIESLDKENISDTVVAFAAGYKSKACCP